MYPDTAIQSSNAAVSPKKRRRSLTHQSSKDFGRMRKRRRVSESIARSSHDDSNNLFGLRPQLLPRPDPELGQINLQKLDKHSFLPSNLPIQVATEAEKGLGTANPGNERTPEPGWLTPQSTTENDCCDGEDEVRKPQVQLSGEKYCDARESGKADTDAPLPSPAPSHECDPQDSASGFDPATDRDCGGGSCGGGDNGATGASEQDPSPKYPASPVSCAGADEESNTSEMDVESGSQESSPDGESESQERVSNDRNDCAMEDAGEENESRVTEANGENGMQANDSNETDTQTEDTKKKKEIQAKGTDNEQKCEAKDTDGENDSPEGDSHERGDSGMEDISAENERQEEKTHNEIDSRTEDIVDKDESLVVGSDVEIEVGTKASDDDVPMEDINSENGCRVENNGDEAIAKREVAEDDSGSQAGASEEVDVPKEAVDGKNDSQLEEHAGENDCETGESDDGSGTDGEEEDTEDKNEEEDSRCVQGGPIDCENIQERNNGDHIDAYHSISNNPPTLKKEDEWEECDACKDTARQANIRTASVSSLISLSGILSTPPPEAADNNKSEEKDASMALVLFGGDQSTKSTKNHKKAFRNDRQIARHASSKTRRSREKELLRSGLDESRMPKTHKSRFLEPIPARRLARLARSNKTVKVSLPSSQSIGRYRLMENMFHHLKGLEIRSAKGIWSHYTSFCVIRFGSKRSRDRAVNRIRHTRFFSDNTSIPLNVEPFSNVEQMKETVWLIPAEEVKVDDHLRSAIVLLGESQHMDTLQFSIYKYLSQRKDGWFWVVIFHSRAPEVDDDFYDVEVADVDSKNACLECGDCPDHHIWKCLAGTQQLKGPLVEWPIEIED